MHYFSEILLSLQTTRGEIQVAIAIAIISRLAKMPRKPLWNNARFNQ